MPRQVTDIARTAAKNAREDVTRLCGHLLSARDGTCRNWKGYRTEHPGEGFCFLHGGKAVAVVGWPRSVAGVAERYFRDPEILSLQREISISRARIQQLEDKKYERLVETMLKTVCPNCNKNIEVRVKAPSREDDMLLARYLDQVRRLVESQFNMDHKRKYMLPIDVVTAMIYKCADIVLNMIETQEERERAIQQFSAIISMHPGHVPARLPAPDYVDGESQEVE